MKTTAGSIDTAAVTRNYPALPDVTGIGADPSHLIVSDGRGHCNTQ
jgi:hypothetical protein